MKEGFFITFEGGDGAGKSTQLALLAERLREAGYAVVTTREPGGTRLGEAIRALLLDPRYAEMQAATEVLLYAAARAQHVGEVIRPALAAGKIVLCDRFLDSSLVYQGVGLGIEREKIWQVNTFATGDLAPDLTFLFDIDPELGLARTQQAKREQGPEENRESRGRTKKAMPEKNEGNGKNENGLDRIEARTLAYHQRVREGFLALAAAEPARFRVISVGEAEPPTVIAARVWEEVVRRLPH